MKTPKHKELFSKYDLNKSKQLEKNATKMLKDDERNQKLKEKSVSNNFFKIFDTKQLFINFIFIKFSSDIYNIMIVGKSGVPNSKSRNQWSTSGWLAGSRCGW